MAELMHSAAGRTRLPAVVLVVAVLVVVTSSACGGGSGKKPSAATRPSQPTQSVTASRSGVPDTLRITSPSFAAGAAIPAQFSCDGPGKSPELDIAGAPSGTKEFALIVHDPDAPGPTGFTHWVLYNIPGGTTRINAGASPGGTLPSGAAEGNNGSGKPGYTGMCPPKGTAAHHYHFRLYALDAELQLPAGQTGDQVEAAMADHILSQTDLVGIFGR